MSRAFCIPGIVFLAFAFILNFLASMSVPSLPALDLVRYHGQKGAIMVGAGVSEVRLGIWGACAYDLKGKRTCANTGHGYTVVIGSNQNKKIASITSSWTKGLAVHPVATGATLLALPFAFSTHLTYTLVSALLSFLAALLTLIAFAIDIAFYLHVRSQVNSLKINAETNTSSGFWMTFAALILLLLAGCTVCFGRRKDRMAGGSTSSYPLKSGIFSRFRK